MNFRTIYTSKYVGRTREKAIGRGVSIGFHVLGNSCLSRARIQEIFMTKKGNFYYIYSNHTRVGGLYWKRQYVKEVRDKCKLCKVRPADLGTHLLNNHTFTKF